MFPEGAIPIVPVHAGPKSERMSPNRLETTTSNECGCNTKCADRISIWNLSQRSSGESLLVSTTRSFQYAIAIEMPFGLCCGCHVLLRTPLCNVEREAQDPINPMD